MPYPAEEEVAAAKLIVSTLSRRPRGPARNPAANPAAASRAKTKRGSSAGGGGGGTSGNSHGSAALTCESPLCNKNPSFGYRGETRRRFCKRHAEPGMLNMYYKYCDADAAGGKRCPERASFEAGGRLRCLNHREPGMRPRNNICQLEGGGCTRQSSYGVEGGKPVLCTLHKEAGMVQVRQGAPLAAVSSRENLEDLLFPVSWLLLRVCTRRVSFVCIFLIGIDRANQLTDANNGSRWGPRKTCTAFSTKRRVCVVQHPQHELRGTFLRSLWWLKQRLVSRD